MILSAEPRRPTIFVVEDDAAVRRSLEFVLELEGFLVVSFPSGGAALGHRGRQGCDCLVVDLRLPDCDGLNLIELLQARSPTPAILITTCPKPAERRRAQAMDVVLVEKPLLGNRFVNELKRLAGNH
ncbi:response regulator [Aureimonas mangrovi]|uniref:response regulator n=1 Tax=Aureimonas mangrovi TaxID=2758041 RepID=UPI00163D8948|nr:response regulator [Aureimonas mangrovi]